MQDGVNVLIREFENWLGAASTKVCFGLLSLTVFIKLIFFQVVCSARPLISFPPSSLLPLQLSAKKPHEDPTVLVADITARLTPIKHEVARLDRKPKPKPAVVPKAAKNATAGGGGNETASEEPAAAGEPAGEGSGSGGAEKGGEGEAAPEGEAGGAEETKEEL